MTPKIKKVKMHLFYCLCQLMLECLDELQVTTPRMLLLKEQLIEFCELLNEEVKDTYTIQKSTYFQELTNKINTVLRKNFNENM
jgi:hypothetical protein